MFSLNLITPPQKQNPNFLNTLPIKQELTERNIYKILTIVLLSLGLVVAWMDVRANLAHISGVKTIFLSNTKVAPIVNPANTPANTAVADRST